MTPRRLAQLAAAVLAALAAPSALAQNAPAAPVEMKPADVQWKDDARAPGLKMAVMSGDPKQVGLYVVRVKLAKDAKLQPHTHPDVRYTTVLAGEVMLGFGETFDAAKMKAYPAGTLIIFPANSPHYVWSKTGETIIQDVGIGPTGSTPVTASASQR